MQDGFFKKAYANMMAARERQAQRIVASYLAQMPERVRQVETARIK